MEVHQGAGDVQRVDDARQKTSDRIISSTDGASKGSAPHVLHHKSRWACNWAWNLLTPGGRFVGGGGIHRGSEVSDVCFQ